MRVSLPTLAVASVFAAVGACQCDELSVIPGSLNGRVCDAETGIGIPGAGVKLSNGHETLTDQTGAYTFARLPPGEVDITATSGDLQRTFHARVESSKAKIVEDSACRPLPGDPGAGVIDGDICNRHTGALVQNADVSVVRSDGEMLSTTTDENGHFSLGGVPEGHHVVIISATGFQRSVGVDVPEGGGATIDLADDCTSPSASSGSIAGRACDPTDQGLSAAVTLTRMNGEEPTEDVIHDFADVDGSFFVAALEPGTWDVVVAYASHELRERVQVIAGQTANVNDPVACGDDEQLGRIEGELCDTAAGGLFVGHVTLLLNTTDIVQATDTDVDGHFALEHVAPGEYAVRLTHDTFERTISPVIVHAFQTTFMEETNCPTPEQCHQATPLPSSGSDGRILFVVDKSGSMGEGINANGSGNSKYDTLRNTIAPVLTNLDSNVEMGLMFYPRPGSGDECAVGELEVPLGPGQANAIQNQLNNHSPNGKTPTAPTLSEARDVLAPLVADGRPIAVVLATDGAPNCNGSLNGNSCACSNPEHNGNCGDTECLDDGNSFSAVGGLRDLGVETYVLGLPGVEGFDGVLDNMAQIGGTARVGQLHKYYPATSQAELAAALEAITTRVLACRIEVGEDLNTATTVGVTIDGTNITRDPARQNGWDITSPTTVELFGTACDAAVLGTSTVVDICR